MQELYVGQSICKDELEQTHLFQYHLLTDELMYDGIRCPDYGILVRSGDGVQTSIPHITSDRNRIDSLISLLQEHQVSPVHLQDIVEDWL